MNTRRFLGYDTDENGRLAINHLQTEMVKRLFEEYLNGKTVDYIKRIFTKKRAKNGGEIQKYYVQDYHDAIIEPWVWECAQLEGERRKRYMQEHGTKSYFNNTKRNSPQDRKSTFEPQVVKSARRISPISTRKSYPCMPRA